MNRPSAFSLCCLALGAALQLAAPAPGATPAVSPRAEELATIFRPFETDYVTLSPEGRHLAYTERRGEALFLVLRDLEANTLKRVPLEEDRAAEMSGAREKTPARVTFLRWASGSRLVFNLNGRNVWSIRADGTDPRRLADPRDFQHLPMTLTGGNGPPPPVDTALHANDQPINIVAVPREQKYVFVEAIQHSYGEQVIVRAGANGNVSVGTQRTNLGPVRVVQRYDVTNGKSDDWGEVEANAFDVLADQQGHPRVARLPILASLTTAFIHARPQSRDWQPLDELLGRELALAFHDSPENHLGERSVPLAFDYDPNLLYYASNVGRDTVGLYALDLKQKQRTAVAVETPVVDLVNPRDDASADALVFDGWRKKLVGIRSVGAERTTLWLDPELAEIQRTLHEAVPKQTVEIVEWDEARSRFLVQASSQIDPGTYYVFHREEERLDHVMQRAPWLTPATLYRAISFEFRTPSGTNLTGYLTLPRRARLKLPPLVVLCHDGPWSRDYPGFDRQAQALAAMGFAVVQVNYRGSTGFGRKHLDALRGGFDTVAAEDVVATVDWVLKTEKVDRRLVAIMGTGYGGYLALRALQLYPTRFRCAVALDAPVDLPTWINPPSRFEGEMRRAFLGADTAKLEAMSPLNQPDKIAGPVMLIQREGNRAARAQDLRAALAKLGREVEFLSLDRDAAADLPQARAALFLKIEAFFNAYIYNYAVKLGETIEVK